MESLDGWRCRKQSHRGSGGDAKGSLGTNEGTPQIIAGCFAGAAPQAHDGAVFQHHFKAQHMIGGHAVSQAVGASSILGDVPADAACPLAGRVGSVAHAVLPDPVVEVEVDDCRLHRGQPVLPVYLQDTVHAG